MDLERILNPASGYTRLEDLNIKQLQKLVEMYNLQTKIAGYKTKSKDQLILELRQKVPNIDAKTGMLEGLTIKQVIKLVQQHNADAVIKNYKKLSKAQMIQALRQRLPHLEFAPEVPESITPEALVAEEVGGDPFEEKGQKEPISEPDFTNDFNGLGEDEVVELDKTPYVVDRDGDLFMYDAVERGDDVESIGNIRDDDMLNKLSQEALDSLMIDDDVEFNKNYNLIRNQYNVYPRQLHEGALGYYFEPNYAKYPEVERGTYILNGETGQIFKDGEEVDSIIESPAYTLPLELINKLRKEYSVPRLYTDYEDPDEVRGDPFEEEASEAAEAKPDEIFVNLGNFTYNRKKRTIRENPSYAAPKKPTEYRILNDSEYSAKELQRFPPRFDDTSPEAIAKLPEDRRQLTAEDLAQLQTYRDDIFYSPEELALHRKLGVFYPLTTQREQVILYEEAESDAYTFGGLQSYGRLGKGEGIAGILRREKPQREQRVKTKSHSRQYSSKSTELYTRDGENAGTIYFNSYGHRRIKTNPIEGFKTIEVEGYKPLNRRKVKMDMGFGKLEFVDIAGIEEGGGSVKNIGTGLVYVPE
jgi:hypothetical protein